MRLQKLYTALSVGDLARAQDWYTRLLGRGPVRPMPSLIQWETSPGGGLQLTSDGSPVGQGGMSLVVDDVKAERARLAAVGIALGDSFQGSYSTLAQVRDPDGNLIVLATPPDPAYPKA
ncbi:VOC family protein [Paracoccus shanxieyensis]|uniref:VOC family protein n=1 Tax=Paracoccus shanxieyensis TaxID=2675752 RepID=A0A6L6J017_9RHOB|nr:VOC family protein [Paracoccus shanxieyensis]MTH65221.1 VOC family protein [Paracoccus shanxieyensis]MTH88475.1 VOC family protein [Paracoccus shanxieyensis]